MKRGGIFRGWLEALPAPAYVLGEDGAGLGDLLAELWLERFRAEGVPTELARWTVPDMERESPSAAWRSASFFARQRIFVLPDLQEMKKGMRDETAGYLRAPDPTALLVIPCSDRKMSRAFAGLPGVQSMAPREDEVVSALAGHAVAKAAAAGAVLAPDAATFLVRWIGTDYARLSAELAKLLSFAAGRKSIGEEEIRAVCVGRGEVNPFDFAGAILRNEGRKCLEMGRAFAATADSSDYHALVGAIAWKTRAALGGRGGVPAARAGKILSALSRMDRELKGGSALSPEQVLEINLLKLLG